MPIVFNAYKMQFNNAYKPTMSRAKHKPTILDQLSINFRDHGCAMKILAAQPMQRARFARCPRHAIFFAAWHGPKSTNESDGPESLSDK